MSDYSDYRDKFTEYDRLYEYSEDPFSVNSQGTGHILYMPDTKDRRFHNVINGKHSIIKGRCTNFDYTRKYSEIFKITAMEDNPNGISQYDLIYLYSTITSSPPHLVYRLVYRSVRREIPNVAAQWPSPEASEFDFSIEFSQNGSEILINGKPPEGLCYISEGLAEKAQMKLEYEIMSMYIGHNISGVISDFKIIDGDTGETNIHYPLSKDLTYAQEVIHGLDAEYIPTTFHEQYGDGTRRTNNLVGYPIYPEFLKWGDQLPENIIPEHPFAKTLPVDRSIPPTDEQIAWLKWKDTGLPALKMDGVWTNHTVAEVERNEKCWYYKKAFTCVSTLAELHWFKTTVTLISPRHVVIAEHVRDDWGPNNGTCDATGYKNRILHFMDMDSNVQTVQAIDHVCLGSDVAILLLAEPITLDIEYAKFLPPYFADNVKCTSPIAITPNREGALVIETMMEFFGTGLTTDELATSKFEWSRWTYSDDRIGDSSRPTFIYDGDQLFLCFVATTYYSMTPASGRGIRGLTYRSLGTTFFNNQIQQAMNDLDDRNVEYTGVSHCEVQIGEISQEWIRDNM